MKLYTVIPYFKYFDAYDGNSFDIDTNGGVKTFTTYEAAENYAYTLSSNYEIIENELND